MTKALKKRRPVTGIEKLVKTTLLAAGGWILYSTLRINHEMHLPEAVTAERKVFFSEQAGKLSYYTDQKVASRPLVLIHSVNAAASAYEMRPLFEHYRSQRPVFALDLPGFGFSERSSRVYHPELFEKAVLDFLTKEVKEPADVVALSLGGEFAARAAVNQPQRFHSLALISPTGLSQEKSASRSQQARETGSSDMLYPVFSFPVWARAFFDLIATRWSVQYFLNKSFTGPVPQSLVNYSYASAHQPGAENAPLYFLSGKLFTRDVRTRFYEALRVSTLAIYDRDPFTSFEMLPELLQNNKEWQAVRIIPTMGLPHWEQLPRTTAALDQFWQGLA